MPTFREAVEQWWLADMRALGAIRSTTVVGYLETLERYAFPAFGQAPVDPVTRQQLLAMIDAMRAKGLEPSTMAPYVRVVCRFFNYAIDTERLRGPNPAARLVKFINNPDTVIEAPDETIRPFSIEAMTQLLETTCASGARPCYYPMLLCGFHVGLRPGEICGLQLGDIDLAHRRLTVRRTIRRTRRWNETERKWDWMVVANGPKTRKGKLMRPQTVPMTETLAQALQAYLSNAALNARRASMTSPWLFFTDVNDHWEPKHFGEFAFPQMLRAAGLPLQHTPHDIWHTFATILLGESQNIDYVKKRLRHASLESTEVYTLSCRRTRSTIWRCSIA